MTPMKAIRARCLDCSGGSSKEVRSCTISDCPLYEYRLGHRPQQKILTPMRAIRAHCVSCCNGSTREPTLCTAKKCPLQPYKLGKRPQRHNPPSELLEDETMAVAPNFLANTAIYGGGIE